MHTAQGSWCSAQGVVCIGLSAVCSAHPAPNSVLGAEYSGKRARYNLWCIWCRVHASTDCEEKPPFCRVDALPSHVLATCWQLLDAMGTADITN